MLGVDFDEFLADVPGGLQRMLAHFGAAGGRRHGGPARAQPRADAIFQGARSIRTDPALRARILDEARRDHREEIARGMRWLERIAKTDAVAAAVLDGGAV